MKLMEIAKKPDGTYAGVHFSQDTRNALKEYMQSNDIPHAVPTNKLHTTVLYSRKYIPEYKPKGMYDPIIKGVPTGFELWPSQPDEHGKKTNCLVLCFDAPDLTKRHESLMDKHDATYDFDEYKTHVTLSYDAGDIDTNSLPPLEEELEITEEYKEDLDLSWAQNHTTK